MILDAFWAGLSDAGIVILKVTLLRNLVVACNAGCSLFPLGLWSFLFERFVLRRRGLLFGFSVVWLFGLTRSKSRKVE